MLLRFYKPYIERVLMGLVFMQENGFTMKHFLEFAGRGRGVLGVEDPTLYALHRAAGRHGAAPDLPTMIKLMGEQLTTTEKVDDGELIDLIVTTLQLPFSRNILAGPALHSLRQAILLPTELAGLRTRLQAQETSCGHCGQEVVNGELVTMVREGGGLNSVWCQRCAPAVNSGIAIVACQKCSSHVPLAGKVVKLLKIACQTCLGRKVDSPGAAEVEPITILNDPPVFRRMTPVAGTATGRGGGAEAVGAAAEEARQDIRTRMRTFVEQRDREQVRGEAQQAVQQAQQIHQDTDLWQTFTAGLHTTTIPWGTGGGVTITNLPDPPPEGGGPRED